MPGDCIACGNKLTEVEAIVGNECNECFFALRATAAQRNALSPFMNPVNPFPTRPETIRIPVGDHALDRAHKEVQRAACRRLADEQRKNQVLGGFLAFTAPIAVLGLIAIFHQILK